MHPTVAQRFVEAPEVAVTQLADWVWIIGGVVMGAISGAIAGLLGLVVWSGMSPAAFTAYMGTPLILAMGIPAILGGAAILIAAASSAAISADDGQSVD